MLFQLSILVLAASSALGATSPVKRQNTTACNSGPVQCCNHVQQPESDNYSTIASIIQSGGFFDFGSGSDLGLQGLSAPIGIDCTPLSAFGAGSGGTCNSEPVCCDQVHSSGALALSCTPFTVNL